MCFQVKNPNKCTTHYNMKFIQRTSLQDQVDQKHTSEVRTMDTTESANLDLLELKDFSLQEYLNQSYDLSESQNKIRLMQLKHIVK